MGGCGLILDYQGTVMSDLAKKYLQVDRCTFIPRHTKNLANEFSCYINYDDSFLK